jgi:hypothetical protein
MTILRDCGINAFWLHRIRTYCPSLEILRILQLRLAHSDLTEHVSEAKDELTVLSLHQRLMPDLDPANHKRILWTPQHGFTPSNTVGPSTVTYRTDNRCGRVLRQGIGVITDSDYYPATAEDELVERVPTMAELGASGTELTAFAEKLTQHIIRHDPCDPPRTRRMAQNYPISEDTGAGIKLLQQPSYEVVELEFASDKVFRALTHQPPVPKNLCDLVVYCLARNYGLSDSAVAPVALDNIVQEVNHGVFRDLFADNVNGDGKTLANLSQTTRMFVSLGRRGAVIAYWPGRMHRFLRVAALNMIEILRGRYHNFVLARTLLDMALRNLSDSALLQRDDRDDTDEKKLDDLLRLMMKANHLYGLAVSDPGAFLLDGSTLTILAANADTLFDLRSLREDSERKMNALDRFWREFQDQRRTRIVQRLSGYRPRGDTRSGPPKER